MFTGGWSAPCTSQSKNIAVVDSKSVVSYEKGKFKLWGVSAGASAVGECIVGEYKGSCLRVLRSKLLDKKSGMIEVRKFLYGFGKIF